MMDPEAQAALNTMRSMREQERARVADLEEQISEYRAQLQSEGADPVLLREFELCLVDLALVTVLERNSDKRLENAEAAAEES